MLDKPTILISSTIYDFKDLRSALKFNLELLGYRVLLSEYNDFVKNFDNNSYNACMETVNQADYVILLIGSRIGGFYDKEKGLTITRKEYKEAYKRVIDKKTILFTFVRNDIWTVREDRIGMEKIISEEIKRGAEFNDTQISLLKNHPSKIINDAKVTFDFISEIAREGEMSDAISGNGAFPIGNWIHTFSSYEDIFKALEVGLHIQCNIKKKILISNLCREMIHNVAPLLVNDTGNTFPITIYSQKCREKINGKFEDHSTIPGSDLKSLVFFIVNLQKAAKNIKKRFIDEALNSGEFVEFDALCGKIKHGDLVLAIDELRSRYDLVNEFIKGFDVEWYSKDGKWLSSQDSKSIIDVPNAKIVIPMTLHDAVCDILSLSAEIYKALDKNISLNIESIKLSPRSVLSYEIKELDKGKVSYDIAEHFLLYYKRA